MSYALFQCVNPDCRFRFPAATDVEPDAGFECPHCGSVTAMSPNTAVAPADRDEALSGIDVGNGAHLELFLDNIRSVGNVGSLFRTADGVGIRALHLGGITATPEHPRFAKSALGVPLPWGHRLNGVEYVAELKARGHAIWALEETQDADDLFDVGLLPMGRSTVLVVGNEVMGIDPEILQICDRVLSIPMRGVKRSLNVVVACGIAAYVLLHGRSEQTTPELA